MFEWQIGYLISSLQTIVFYERVNISENIAPFSYTHQNDLNDFF